MKAFDRVEAERVAVKEWQACRRGWGPLRPDPRGVLQEAANNLVARAAAHALANLHSDALILTVAADTLLERHRIVDARAGESIRRRLERHPYLAV